jgi:transcriptional regulator with XRE-family HTH domain
MADDTLCILGRHIAAARKRAMLTQVDLARELGMHEITLSRIENGKMPGLTVALLVRLALRLNLSLDEALELPGGLKLRADVTILSEALHRRLAEAAD